jgi:hypothetical protein
MARNRLRAFAHNNPNGLTLSGTQADLDGLTEAYAGIKAYSDNLSEGLANGNTGAPDWQAFFDSLAKFLTAIAPILEMIIKMFVVVP